MQLIAGDNGSGFEVAAMKKGAGLSNIDARLQSIKAQYKWKKQPQKSVRLIINVPHDK